MTDTDLAAAIARVKNTLMYGYNEDLLTGDLRTIIAAAEAAQGLPVTPPFTTTRTIPLDDVPGEVMREVDSSVLTLSGETVNGIPVFAYAEDVDTPLGNVTLRFSTHWSTPGKGAKNVRRLFAEADVMAALSRPAEPEFKSSRATPDDGRKKWGPWQEWERNWGGDVTLSQARRNDAQMMSRPNGDSFDVRYRYRVKS